MINKNFHRSALFGLVLVFFSSTSSAETKSSRTDVIYLKNGNSITGEIKELELGELRLTTDAMGDIYIKWVYVEKILSDKAIQFELTDGTRYVGSISEIDDDPGLNLITSSGEVILDREDIVHMQRLKIDESVWSAMDKRLQLGYQFEKSTDIVQWNIAAGLKYTREKYVAELSFDSRVTNDGNGDDSNRSNFTGTYRRLLRDRWFWFGTGALQQNDQLGIQGRFLASGGGGRILWQNQKSELMLAGGLAVNKENSTSTESAGSESGTDMEGVFQASWTRFINVVPRSRLSADLQYYPSITDTGRYRANFDLRYRQEFIKDLFWRLTWYASYDSKPPQSAEAKDDFGFITALEYNW